MAKTLIGTATTDGNGEATITYEATGAGDVTIVAESGRLSSGPYDIKDAIYYNPTPFTSWTRLNIPNLPSNFKISFICKTNAFAHIRIGENISNMVIFGVFDDDDIEMGLDLVQGYHTIASDFKSILPANTDVELVYSVDDGIHTLSDGTHTASLDAYTARNYFEVDVANGNYIKELLIMPL